MTLGGILSDAVKYPFSDITKFLIVGVLVLLAGIVNVVYPSGEGNMILMVLLSLVGIIFAIILSGHCVDVIKNGIQHSSEVPDIDPAANLIDGIKVIIIELVYYIIPLIIAAVLGAFSGFVGAGLNLADSGLSFAMIVALIVFIIFSILEIVAIARFADTGDLGAAFKFGEVFEYAKRIGIINIILFSIVTIILAIVLAFILALLSVIPFIGAIIAMILLGGFLVLFYYRGIGLLYASA